MVFITINQHFFFDLAHANNYLMIGFWIFDNNKNKIVNIGNRKNYLNLFDRDNHPTYYDNIVIYKNVWSRSHRSPGTLGG